jgi:uncharacterized membrane protein YtjA (UPF0391 family)
MLSWAALLLILAIVAALFGFTVLAGAAAGIAQILFFLFLGLLIVVGIARAFRGATP